MIGPWEQLRREQRRLRIFYGVIALIAIWLLYVGYKTTDECARSMCPPRSAPAWIKGRGCACVIDEAPRRP